MDLVNRLKFFMENRDITISQFADTCMIPRPTMSQILNGRNKKISDELISKIHVAFPELSVLWLMFGEGEMLINKNIEISEPQTSANTPNTGYHLNDIQHSTPIDSDGSRFDIFDSDKKSDSHLPYQAAEIANSTSFTSNATVNATDNGDTPIDSPVIDFGEPARQTAMDTFHEQSPNSGVPYTLFASSTGAEQEVGARTENGRPVETRIPNEIGRSTETGRHAETDRLTETGKFPSQPFNNPTTIQQNTPRPDSEKNADTTQLNGNKTESHALGNTTVHSISTPAHKRITNIVVFYSDNSFQSFSPE